MMSINRKILFVSPPATFLEEPAFVPHLGLLYISAALKSMGCDDSVSPQLKYIELAHFNLDDAISNLSFLVNKWEPGIIAFTSTTPQFPSVKSIAKELKDKFSTIRLIIGGVHATNYTADVLNSELFDHVFVGESEEEIVKFWQHYISGSTTPVYKSQSSVNINSIIMPDWTIDGLNVDLYSCAVEGKKALPILTSRGCVYSCAFCEKQPKGFRRERDVNNIRTELELIFKLNINALVIYDCCLVINMARALQLRELFTDMNFSHDTKIIWRAFMRANNANDDILHILKQAGCEEIGFGIESGSDEILHNINKKPCNRTDNINAIQACRKAGIKSKAFLMVGLPGETKKTVDETISWVLEAEPNQIDVSLYMPYKGSDIGNHPEKYDITLHTEDCNTSKMFYKGAELTKSESFVSIPSKGLSKGLDRADVYEQFVRLRNFKKKYNHLVASVNRTTGETKYSEALETYKILSTLVIHEGNLIWEQLKLFISTNSLLVIALGLFVQLANPATLVISVGILGIIGCFVWYRIYQKSWYNQKIWFYLARKQEVSFRFAHIYSEGAMIRQGREVNDFTEKSWKLNNIDKMPITYWMMIWILGFLLFWIFVTVVAMFFPKILQTLP